MWPEYLVRPGESGSEVDCLLICEAWAVGYPIYYLTLCRGDTPLPDSGVHRYAVTYIGCSKTLYRTKTIAFEDCLIQGLHEITPKKSWPSSSSIVLVTFPCLVACSLAGMLVP